MKFIKILIYSLLLLSVQNSKATTVMNAQDDSDLELDTILNKVMAFAPLYEDIVEDYSANLYIKGKLNVIKNNIFFRYVPSMFRLKKGVRHYIFETMSDLHFTAPDIYDQKVRASVGTVQSGKGVPNLFEFFNVNVYSESILNDDRFLSPLAKNAYKYYTFKLDSITGDDFLKDYHISYTPKIKTDLLLEGSFVVTDGVWSLREMSFAGTTGFIKFNCKIEMGKVGERWEFLPITYSFNALFSFLGNKIDGDYDASLDYKTIKFKKHTQAEAVPKKRDRFNLSNSFTLKCDTNLYKSKFSDFEKLRPFPLTCKERSIYHDYFIRKDTAKIKEPSKYKIYLGKLSDTFIEDNNLNLKKFGSIQFSPIINPLLFSYGSKGISYRQDFNYTRLFTNDKSIRVMPSLGYNFTHKEFYWSLNTQLQYLPSRLGQFNLKVGSGNRIYSNDILDEVQNFNDYNDFKVDYDKLELGYFRDLYINFSHSIEVLNGLKLDLGISAHRRNAVHPIKYVKRKTPPVVPFPDYLRNLKNLYISFAPRVNIEWTPYLYYYMNGRRKIYFRSNYPTFSVDYERGIKGVFKSNGQYERVEVDMQHKIRLGLLRSLYYRVGLGLFTNNEELFFVDFRNFSSHNLPVGWNDEIGGVFQLLDSKFYNSSLNYVRGHLTYEAPFLLIPHLMKIARHLQNERLYFSVLSVPHLHPYAEFGYGIGTSVFDVGVFCSFENWNYKEFGCKFTFELFNR